MPKAANYGAHGHYPVLRSGEGGMAGVGSHPSSTALLP